MLMLSWPQNHFYSNFKTKAKTNILKSEARDGPGELGKGGKLRLKGHKIHAPSATRRGGYV
eukprot:4028961-Karenia_brevis.AAC.1